MVRSTETKIGYFDLPENIVMQQPEKLKVVFAKVIVITAVKMMTPDVRRYLAYSDEFDWVPKGAKVPFYECGRHKNGLVYFKRKD